MIPKDILENLYLKLFHAEIKKEVGPSASTGRTVRLLLADRPQGQRGPSAWLVGRRCVSGRSGSNNGQSAPGVWTVRAPRGLSAGASRTVRPCHARVGPRPRDVVKQPSFSFPNPTLSSSFSPFLLPLKEKGSLLGMSFGHSPDCPSTSPDSPRFSTMSSGYFFISHILSLGSVGPRGPGSGSHVQWLLEWGFMIN
jgi:hypothetical protein